MRTVLIALVAAAGLAEVAHAQGFMEFQVSSALAENWTSSLDAQPGQAIDMRVRLTYFGEATAVGLGSVFFQPALSNWDNSGLNRDLLHPFLNQGGSGTTPLGDVPDAPGLYGRVSPWGWRAPHTGAPAVPNPYLGHVNSVSGVNYLRIAQTNCTNWIGGAGNTAGGRGINVGQPNENFIWSQPDWPHPYERGVTDLVVLKLGITLSQDTDLRTLLVSTAEAFSGEPNNYNTQVKWYQTAADNVPGSLFGDVTYVPATIHVVPAPWSVAVVGTAIVLRRRRRE